MSILFREKLVCGTQNGRPLGVAPTASEQAALRSDFEYKISHTLRCPSFSAKSHVCFGYALASARITPALHYQLFAVCSTSANINSVGFIIFDKLCSFRFFIQKSVIMQYFSSWQFISAIKIKFFQKTIAFGKYM